MPKTTDPAELRRLADQAEARQAYDRLRDLADALAGELAELSRTVRDPFNGDAAAGEQLVAARAIADRVRAELVHASARYARSRGQTWQQIGDALGMTRSAAQRRFAATVPAELRRPGRARGGER